MFIGLSPDKVRNLSKFIMDKVEIHKSMHPHQTTNHYF